MAILVLLYAENKGTLIVWNLGKCPVTQDNTPEDFEHLSAFLVHTCTNMQP